MSGLPDAADAPAPPGLLDEIAKVGGMILDGAPRTLFLDEEALEDSEVGAASPVAAKLAALDIDAVILAGTPSAADRLLPTVHRLQVAADPRDEVARPAIGVFGGSRDPIPDCYGWYVGAGEPPGWMRPTGGRGAAMTDSVLALYGTSLVQERAGAAFRASGQGQPIPERHPYPRTAILDGITTAVAPAAVLAAGDRGPLPGEQRGQLERATDDLVTEAYRAIAASCTASGAIAAAPPPKGPGEPNYQFFWPRDGGQVASAIALVAQESADQELRAVAAEHFARYRSFVGRLARRPSGQGHLAVSRFTLEGEPIREYGSPQLDGPAQTVLAVLAGTPDTDDALTVAAPYLDLLASPAVFGLTFDLWEFSVGQAFHALNLARRALRAGAARARAAGNPAADRYADAEQLIEKRLGDFYDERRGYVVAALDCAIPWMETLSKLDAAVVGSVLAAFDVTDDAFNVDDPRIAATMKALEDHYAGRWAVNHAWRSAGHDGFALGRFPEDTNDGLGSTGGNPWTFVTLWAAQFHLRSIQRQRYLGARAAKASAEGEKHLADALSYLRFVLAHVPVDALPEQIDRVSGRPRGARPLAWAHAELITTLLLLDEVTSAPGQ